MKPFCLLLLSVCAAQAAAPAFVDLPTVMRLAGAKNEEVEIARVQHEHALLESTQAWQRFWPTLSAGGQYRGHDGRLQDIVGSVFDARKQQYSLGGAVLLDWAPGDIYYGALAAKQRALAAGQALEKARLDILREATDRYYEMLGAEAAVAVVADDLTVLQRYAEQLDNAVKVGTAFRADLLRVHTQISRLKIQMRQGEEQRGVAAARLCETLRLAPDTELHPAKADLVPIKTVPNESLSALVARGQINRPEIKAVNALGSSLAREEERVRLGPLVPSLQAGYSAGGFGGGPGRATGNFGDTQDYFVGFGWKIGPGGLFDTTRERIAVARKESAALQTSRTKAAVGRDVVEAALRSQSSEAQIRLSDEAVAAAEEMSKLAAERQASQVGVVLEFVLAREDLTRARLSRVRAVVDYNRAQQALRCAVGDPVGKTAPAAKSGSKQGR